MRTVEVVITYLVLPGRDHYRPSDTVPAEKPRLVMADPDATAAAAMELYTMVGAPWHWTDRCNWTIDDWRIKLEQDDAEIHTLVDRQGIGGYFQLGMKGVDTAEIQFLGLMADRIGRGLGGWLLGRAVERGWRRGAAKIELNTCTLDGPHALANYLARGFQPVRQETRMKEIDG